MNHPRKFSRSRGDGSHTEAGSNLSSEGNGNWGRGEPTRKGTRIGAFRECRRGGEERQTETGIGMMIRIGMRGFQRENRGIGKMGGGGGKGVRGVAGL